MLEVLLREQYPSHHIEVINAAMVAISSNVILSIAQDCVRQKPDFLVIYMGNNEVIGPFGSASIFGARASALPLVQFELWMKTTRVGQLLDASLYSVRHGFGPVPEWNGMEMMAGQSVRHDAPATARVYRHFASNLTDILKSCVRAGVPVILCTVATNIRDCPPFASLHRVGLGSRELTEWENAYTAGIAFERQGHPAEAQTAYKRAASIDNQSSDLAFRRAQCAHLLGFESEAATLFRLARDLDALQFRADGRINDTIRGTAAVFANHRVALFDAEKAFAANSPQGTPGEDFFYEHVHLTPEGNYLLASGVAQQAATILGLPSSGRSLSQAECLRQLGFTDWNRHDALQTIFDRIQKLPFTTQMDHEAQVERVKAGLARYLPATQPEQLKREVAQVAGLVTAQPADPDLRWNLAALLEDAGDTSGAEAQWRAIMSLQPRSPWPIYNLARLLDGLGRQDEARSYYLAALSIEPMDFDSRFNLGRLCLLGNLLPEAIHHLNLAARQRPRSIDARLALGVALARDLQPIAAEKQFREVLRLDPGNVHAQDQLRALQSGR
jgi:tetratricopeptide (TPR) repeat protein